MPSNPRVEYKKLLPMFHSKKLFKGYAVGGFNREPVAIKDLTLNNKVDFDSLFFLILFPILPPVIH